MIITSLLLAASCSTSTRYASVTSPPGGPGIDGHAGARDSGGRLTLELQSPVWVGASRFRRQSWA